MTGGPLAVPNLAAYPTLIPIEPGTRFHQWTVLGYNGRAVNGGASWLCRCECGAVHGVKGVALRIGASRRCRACMPKYRRSRDRVCRECDAPFVGHSNAVMCPTCRPLVERFEQLHDRGMRRLTVREFNAMVAACAGRCEICGAEGPRGPTSLAIDHCHRTGAIRGLLCTPCNGALAAVRDRPEVLRRAADYLEQEPK